MKPIRPVHLIFLAVFIISVVIYVNYDFKKTEDISKQMDTEYPLIKNNEQIDGMVTNIYIPEGFRISPYSRRIVIDSNIKKSVLSYSKNRENLVGDVLTISSRLVKEAGSDTLCIQNIHGNDTISYYFKLE